MRINLFWRTLPGYLVLLSFFALPLWQQHSAHERAISTGAALAKHVSAMPKQAVISGMPVRVVIPRLAVDVQVVKGTYYSNAAAWSVSSIYANFAQNTAPSNNELGKTLIYGHWTQAIFGKTKDLEVGDYAYVTTDNNHVFTYVYHGNEVVKPTDTQLLSSLHGGKPGLMLMTCQGLWAQDRRVMFFDLKQAA